MPLSLTFDHRVVTGGEAPLRTLDRAERQLADPPGSSAFGSIMARAPGRGIGDVARCSGVPARRRLARRVQQGSDPALAGRRRRGRTLIATRGFPGEGVIAGLGEVVGVFGGREGVEELADGVPEHVDASGRDPQQGLELGEEGPPDRFRSGL